MKCEAIRNLMSAYIDKDLNDIEKKAFEEHIASCDGCREEYEMLLEVVLECNNIEDVELPENFREELHGRLIAEKSVRKGFGISFGKGRWRAATGLVAAVLIIAVGIGSSNLLNNGRMSAPERGSAAYDTQESMMAPSAPGSDAGLGIAPSDMTAKNKAAEPSYSAAPPVIESTAVGKADVNITFSEELAAAQPAPAEMDQDMGRKVIKSGYLSLKVEDVNNAVNEIKAFTGKQGGFVEHSQVDNYTVNQVADARTGKAVGETTVTQANMSIRVPEGQFDAAMSTIKAMGVLVSENVNGSDITAAYRDTYTRVENLKLQEKRLQELMSKANNVAEVMQVENELNRIRTDIDLQTGQLKQWDSLVSLSTIQISLIEEKSNTLAGVDVPNLWDEAYKGFIGAVNNLLLGLQKLFVLLVTAIPYLAAAAVLFGLGVFGYMRFRKKKI